MAVGAHQHAHVEYLVRAAPDVEAAWDPALRDLCLMAEKPSVGSSSAIVERSRNMLQNGEIT